MGNPISGIPTWPETILTHILVKTILTVHYNCSIMMHNMKYVNYLFIVIAAILRKLSNKHTDHRHHSQSATIGVPSCCILRSSHCKLAVSRLATISALTLFSSTTGLPLMKSTAMTELVFHVCVHACMCERISNPYMRVLLPVTVSSFQEMYVHYNTCTHTLQKQVATEWLPWLQTNWRNNGYRGLLW